MPNPNWKITNQTTKKNLVVIDASVDSATPNRFYYDQNTTILSPATGDVYVKPGLSFEITLPNAHKDEFDQNLPYTFIIAEAETLEPVKAISFRADLSDLRDITVSSNDESAIFFTINFYKNITAFPGSKLAMDFAALDLTDTEAVANFFTTTGDYQRVTIDALTLVRSYYNAIPYGLTNKKDSIIYLYSGDFENNTDTEIARSVGTISIKSNWQMPLPIKPADPFQVTLALKNDAEKSLFYKDGAFWDTENYEIARLSLAATFIVPGQLSLDVAGNDIVLFLIGTINGKDAFGIEGLKPEAENDEIWGIDATIFKKGFKIALGALALAIGIGVLCNLSKFAHWLKDFGKPSDSEIEREQQTEEIKNFITEKINAISAKINPGITVPGQPEILDGQASYNINLVNNKTKQSIENMRTMTEAQIRQVRALGAKVVDSSMELVSDNLDIIQQRLEVDDSPESLVKFREELSGTMELLTQNSTTIFMQKTRVNSHLTAEEKEGFDRAFEVFDKTRLMQEKVNEEIKEIELEEDERQVPDYELEG